MNEAEVINAIDKAVDLYYKTSRQAPLYPLDAVAEYEDWFRTDFIQALTSRLTIQQGRWKAEENSHLLIGHGGRIASDACKQILLPVVSKWIEEEYPIFWEEGLKFHGIISKMQGAPPPEPFGDADLAQINILVTGEIATQRDHIEHHRRYVERNISAGLSLGWTMERFLQAITVPQGIVGYPYGNIRYSWRTHIERLIQGRSRAVFASASESRALRETGEAVEE